MFFFMIVFCFGSNFVGIVFILSYSNGFIVFDSSRGGKKRTFQDHLYMRIRTTKKTNQSLRRCYIYSKYNKCRSRIILDT